MPSMVGDDAARLPLPLTAVGATVGNPRFDNMPGPANTPAEPHRLRKLAGIDKPTNMPCAHVEHFGDMLNAEHGGRRCRPTAAGVSAGGGNVGTHSEFSE